MSIADSSSRARADKIIAEWAIRQSRKFFYELKIKTRDYRTIDSLGKLIAQEYQDRCILELLQNAHDALANAKSADPRQISFVLITTPEPTLLVGNSGSPFLEENFEGICQLAQSPKDPDESIGNKGVGFRSVLEISTCPEIRSTASPESDLAFAFRFNPDDFKQRMTEATKKLAKEGRKAPSPFDPEHQIKIIDWSQNWFEEYRKRLKQSEFDVAGEIEKLSPYQFPLPIDSTHQLKEVKKLLEEGCVTVIRLPLDGGVSEASEEKAVQSVKAQLEELDARSTLFLSHLETLSIDIDGEQRTLKRKVLDDKFLGCQRTRQQQLSIECSNEDPDGVSTRRFHVWTRDFGGKDHPQEEEKIRDLVKGLPNRLSKVSKVPVGVAVEDTPKPKAGFFVIFLPTEEKTWTGAHINAPFDGSLNRCHINFNESYNKLLLDIVSDLCLDMTKDLVSGEPEKWRAQAVIDILSSSAGEGVMNELLVKRATERGCALKEQALILCDDGWRVSNEARLLDIPDGSPISASQWRECAQFSVVSSALDGRKSAVKKLIKQLNDNGSPDPTAEEWRRTIEQMAENIQKQKIEVTWNDFMKSVIAVLPNDFKQYKYTFSGNSDPLVDMKFLPTESDHLLAASNTAKLFFQPVIGDDAADLAKELPSFLEKHIAFLHQGIQTQEGAQRHNTEVQRFLDRRFVRSFEREEILQVIVKQASPKSSAPNEVSEDATRHAEILAWTLNFVGDDPSKAILDLLKDLPVACYGGWRKMSEVVFGRGWPNTHGDLVWSLVNALPEDRAEYLRKISLLPPDDPHWGAAKESIKDKEDLFRRAGVFDGLRLKEEEDVKFQMGEPFYKLPSSPPSGIPQEDWSDWRKNADMKEPPKSDFEYVLSGIRLLPEIHCLQELNQSGREALSDLVLNSIGHWPDGWEWVKIEKTSGRGWSTDLISPLKHWLKALPWFIDESNDRTTLSQRWLIPAYIRGQKSRFQHLNPLSKEPTKKLIEDAELKDALKSLGLNVYPEEEEEKIGPELLEALASAWSDGSVRPELFDVFLGQVRHAWQHFDAEKELPKRFIVRTGGQKSKSFEVYERDGLSDVYLPDDKDRARTLLEYDKPVLEMEVTKRLEVIVNKLLDETAIKQASKLEEKIVIDDDPWRGETDEIPLLETKYNWLPVPLLAIFAHRGTNPSSAETERWRQAVNRLRGARIRECEDITVQLVDEQEDIVAQSEPGAQWLKKDKVLAVRRDIGFSYKKLAPAVQAILDRQDLLDQLRYVLLSLDGKESPTQEQIDNAVKEVDIDAESLADIRRRWTEDIDSLIERVKPVLWLFEAPTDELDEIKDNQRLKEWLSDNFPRWPELYSKARGCLDDHEMGKTTWLKFGDDAQLPKWNAMLKKLGRFPIGNDDNGGQTEAHIKEVKPLLRGFARHVAIQAKSPGLFLEIEDIRQNFQADKDWSEQWWEVPFEVVLKALCADYANELPDVKCYLSAFENVEKIEDLRAIFEEQGIELEPDPYDTYRRNKDQFDKMFGEFYGLYEIWREDSGLEATSSGALQAPKELAEAAYLNDWQDVELFEQSFAIIENDQFREACAGCASLDEIREQLKLTPKRVKDKRKELRQREDEKRQEEDRKRRTHRVAGADFVVGESDYGKKLFEHIKSLPEPEAPPPGPDEFPPLEEMAGTGNDNSGGRGGGGGSYSPPSAESREIVGVAGEMWAFRHLRAMFKGAVTLDDWVSKNRLKCLPPVRGEKDRTDDSLGYDFSFPHQGENWHVEVKATMGDETQFDLGVTEIEAAIRIAQRSSEQWRVLRVRQALSEEPKFDWLPNPFKEGFRKHFRLLRSGMRVSYKLKNAPSGEE